MKYIIKTRNDGKCTLDVMHGQGNVRYDAEIGLVLSNKGGNPCEMLIRRMNMDYKMYTLGKAGSYLEVNYKLDKYSTGTVCFKVDSKEGAVVMKEAWAVPAV